MQAHTWSCDPVWMLVPETHRPGILTQHPEEGAWIGACGVGTQEDWGMQGGDPGAVALVTTLRTQVRVIRDLPRVGIFSQFQHFSFKDKISDINIRTGLTALRNPSSSAPCCVCVCECVSVCMSLVNLQLRKPEGMWLPAGLRMLFLQAEETGSGVTDVMWRLQRDVVVRTKAVRDPKEPCSPETALPLQKHWPPGVPRVP